MTPSEIFFLKSLDPDCTNGTIQNFIVQEQIEDQNFELVMTTILIRTLQEKQFLVDQNIQLSKELDELRKTV